MKNTGDFMFARILAASSVSLALAACLPEAKETPDITITPLVVQEGVFLNSAPDAGCTDTEGAAKPCYCESEVIVPEFSGFGEARDAELNAEIKDSWGASMACEGTPLAEPGEAMNNASSTQRLDYRGSYNIALHDRSLISITYQQYAYEGGAHGLSAVSSMILDKTTGQPLIISDILKIGRHQNELNAYIRHYLLTRRGDVIFRDDVANNTEPYITESECEGCTLILTASGLYVSFGVYAVGPYSSGYITVPVPPKFIRHPAVRRVAMAAR